MPLGLIALAIGAFGIGLTEFVIMGLLPDVAADFAVSEAAAGWLISGYALSVVVGALGLTAATVRLPRKPVLVGLLVLFILGNSLTAMASTYEVAMIGRVVAALCHGAFFGIGSVVASDLVPANKKAGAIAIMFTGLTAANVLGVPFGTLLGQHAGWRSTFWAISGIGVLALIGILVLVPVIKHAAEGISLRKELGAFTSLQVWLSLGVTILGYGGMFGAFTYIAYTLTEVTGFNESTVPWLLMLFGVGLFVGNWLGGRMADKSIDRTLLFFIAALLVVLIAFGALASSPVATIVALFLMGGFGFGTVPGLQSRIMQFAGSAPTLASGANIGAFNVGNALGAWAGGLGIAAGLGYTSPIWIGAAITVAALLLVLVAMSLAKKSATAPELAPAS
ncbi:MFS transporter [Glutamicibacter halophytocola]|uniref:MFS transporter n=1 Tax=Glutamicibacter halophytocola TaxID=1933880 RepID=A0A5B8IQJ1_9MICC|nr:MFS transporter [Glutamicibacter halophytocola]NQD39449.1 MFS transporter [Glutamicibacter halophytocola]QDY67653.1 MFS transporter [Glutamicibacter halophytocola]UUX59836.1 MFS transporter [Glutamicibacter halophytocola]